MHISRQLLCFFQLRRLPVRRIWRFLDDDSSATLVHAFVASPAGLTTVTFSWSVLWRRRLTSCSVSSTLRYESSPTTVSTIEGCVSSVEVIFIGWTSSTGSSSGTVSRCSSACTTWCLDICRPSANACPAFLVVDTWGRPIAANWTFPVSTWSRTGDGRSHTLVQQYETHYPTIWKALTFLYHPLSAILRPFSLSINTPSAFEVFTKPRYISSLLSLIPELT